MDIYMELELGDTEEYCEALSLLGLVLCQEGSFTEALEVAQRAHALDTRLQPPGHASITSSLQLLQYIHHNLGNAAAAKAAGASAEAMMRLSQSDCSGSGCKRQLMSVPERFPHGTFLSPLFSSDLIQQSVLLCKSLHRNRSVHNGSAVRDAGSRVVGLKTDKSCGTKNIYI